MHTRPSVTVFRRHMNPARAVHGCATGSTHFNGSANRSAGPVTSRRTVPRLLLQGSLTRRWLARTLGKQRLLKNAAHGKREFDGRGLARFGRTTKTRAWMNA